MRRLSLLPILLITWLISLLGSFAAQEVATSNSIPSLSSKFEQWQKAAEKGEIWAAFNLGLAYHLGKETTQNPLEAVKWYRVAAEQGYAPAQANLGYCYDTGFGVSLDHIEAVRWYQGAALQGHPYAQYNLGKKFQNGPGVSLDPKQAEKWLKLAAQQNFVPAYFNLGQIYANETLGNPDYKEAHKWFRLAAEQGYAAAQHAIGYLNFAGKGVQTNYVEAVKWYNLAASRNFADSHYNLAISYERGLGVPQNLIASVNHYRTAAELGHPYAQYSLGVCFYEGKGVELDLVQAYKWWNLAAVQGIPEAATSREILTRLMNEKQIKDAQRLAGEFEVQHVALSSAAPRLQTAVSTSEIRKLGTGFFVSTDGYLLTSSHIVVGATNIQVITEGGTFDATLAKTDTLNDIALLKITGVFQPLPFANSRDTTVDSDVLAVGFDGQNQAQYNPKVARGKITALIGFQADPRQFSLTPHVMPPFGGAAVVNRYGSVIAMIIADLEESRFQQTGPQTSNSYALKCDHLATFLHTSPEVNAVFDDSKLNKEFTPEEILSKARAATALILVL
jgi:TPR repeat protein